MKQHPLASPERGFDLARLPEGDIRKEFQAFTWYKGSVRTLLSMRTLIYPFRMVSAFLSETHPELSSLKEADAEMLVRDMKKWMLRQGKKPVCRRKRDGKETVRDADGIAFLKEIIAFTNRQAPGFSKEKDIWYLDEFPYPVRQNPSVYEKSIRFSFLPESPLKDEFKEIIFIHLQEKAVGTVLCEITAFRQFCAFLEKEGRLPEKMEGLTRDMVEAFLVHVHTDPGGRKNYAKFLMHLKSVFSGAERILPGHPCGGLFLPDDMERPSAVPFVCYSDAEIRRINEGLATCRNRQAARAILLTEILGIRISDTLQLRQDAAGEKDGVRFLRIVQAKTGKAVDRVLPEDAGKIFDTAVRYTRETYGTAAYVFVQDSHPERPMQYRTVRDVFLEMAGRMDLKDDAGEPMGCHMHYFLKSAGKKMADLGMDDETIAKILGHAGTASVHSYREGGYEEIRQRTEGVRNELEKMIESALEGGKS